nr:hypothetical protein GCM10020093_017680 [Planobispora longispora]
MIHDTGGSDDQRDDSGGIITHGDVPAAGKRPGTSTRRELIEMTGPAHEQEVARPERDGRRHAEGAPAR